MAIWYNSTEGTYLIKGEFDNTLLLDGSGIYTNASSGSGTIVITYNASGAKVFSNGVLQYTAASPPNTVNGEGIVLFKNGISTSKNVLYIPRKYSDNEALTAATGNVQLPYYPSVLFAANQIGWHYDHHDDSTLFTDSAGTTPAGLEDPIGLQLDKSGNGNHRFQDVSADRPILSARYNQLIGTEALSTQSVTTRAQDYQLRFSGAGSVTLSGTATGTFNAGTHTVTATAGTLTLTVLGSVTQADLLPSQESSLPYQRVTTATDYDGDKSKFPRYLSCNGTNQWMKTATLDFTSSDKIAVFAGVRKIKDLNNTGLLIEFGTSFNTVGGFYFGAPAKPSQYELSTYTSEQKKASVGSGYPSPVSSVVSTTADNTADRHAIRVDGTLISENLAAYADGNFGSHVLYFFARTGSTLFFQGREYSSIGRLGPITDAEINAIEKYVASRAPGVTI